MGCKLVRGETIYFVRQGGRTSGEIEADWLGDGFDQRLLPPIYTRSDGRAVESPHPSAVTIEIRTFEGS